MVLQDNNFTVVKVARNEDLSEQIGRDIVFDLVNHDKLRCFCIKNQIPFYTFKRAAAKEFGIPVQFQRFWLWAKRENLTYRPHRPLTHEEETQTIGQLRKISQKSQNAELKLFLEVEHGPDSYLIHPPKICKEDILIFFKLYDPAIEKLRYVGRLLVKSTGRPSGILMKLNEMAGFFSSQEIDLYEEIKFEPSVLCEPIEKELTFQASQLENGDIVCFQKSPTVGSGQQYRYPDVPSYLEYVHDRQVVNFRPLEKPNDEGFCVELSKISNYDEVVKKVACQLGVIHPSKIRLTYHNCYTHKPEPTPIKYRGSKHLSDMLLYCNQLSDILYYEVLEDNHFTIIKVARNEDLAQQIGRDICFDLVNHDKVQCFRMMKETPFYAFKEEVAKEFGIPVIFQRFWLWAKRKNLTYRPHRPVTHEEERQPIGQLREISQKSQNAELKLFLEVEHGPDFYLIQPPEICKEDILIFFKLYDPAIEELRYVGRLLVKSTGRPSGILMKLNELAGFLSSQEIDLYEEIKFEQSVMCEPIRKELTFQASQLENGDIVCFQKSPTVGSGQQYRYPDVPSYLEYVHNRLIVHFRPREEPTQAQFSLELSKVYTYEETVTRVAFKLGVYDQSRIRLTPHDSSSNHPKPTPIKYDDKKQLSDILIDDNQMATDILYYEVLEIPASKPSLCVVCFDAPLEGACLPCGHMSACMSCLNEINRRNMGCPVCRADIHQVVRIYV